MGCIEVSVGPVVKRKVAKGESAKAGAGAQVKPVERPVVKGTREYGCCCSCKYSISSAPDWAVELRKDQLWCTKWNKPVSKTMYAIACWRPML